MAEMPPVLPEDLIINEIVLRLPVESIGRCRCVSKPWRRLLSTPQFVKAHLNHHIHDPESIVFKAYSHDCGAPSFATLSSRGGDGDCILKQVNFPLRLSVETASCHGLLLCSVRDDNNKKCVILVNPITLESTEIPDLCFSDKNTFHGRPEYSLGYDGFRDDYKIVSVLPGDIHKDGDQRMDIYSVKTKTWRRLANSPYQRVFSFRPRVFVNGCIHWWALKYGDGGYGSGSVVIAAFNLAREEFEEVPLPVTMSCLPELTVFDGCLAMFIDDQICAVAVWVMKDYGVKDSWFIIKPGIDLHPEDLCLDEVLIGLVGDEVIMKDEGQLVAYNWRNRVTMNLVIPGFPHRFARETGFIPSLVSPKYEEQHE